ncbi:MAG: energy-coupling factor transporter transmembrane protein EcfT [Atopobium sp.]|jgi:energy-coupling factor transport system permease protein|nr:energy-coupling factor transporter transmembrane protein EcfT [Atopobiaceae bacterium]NLH91075.1 energy-coupling factor transporter transmembrane protein EcfT [Atopobium sp.]
MKKSISLYEEKHSFLNGLSPETKLLYVVVAIAIPVMIGGRIPFIAFMAISIGLLIDSKVLYKAKTIIEVSGFILITVVIIQTFFRGGNYTELFRLGPLVARKEGFEYSMGILLNVLNIIFCFCVFVLTTKPSDMMQEMVKHGASPRLGYVFVSLFQIIPQMTEHTSTITDAQRSRGMETEGSLGTRIKAFLPLISPVIMSSFMDTKERSIALEVRGFSSKAKKTFLEDFIPSKYDSKIRMILVIIFISSVVFVILKATGVLPVWLR